MTTKLPKTIYVKREIDGTEKYLIADERPENISKENTIITVGEYELKAMRRLTNRTTVG